MKRQVVCFECGDISAIEVLEDGTHERTILCCPLCGSPDIDDDSEE